MSIFFFKHLKYNIQRRACHHYEQNKTCVYILELFDSVYTQLSI